MIRFSSLILAFVAVFTSSYAQRIPPILQETTYKQGIYRTFTEFVNNAPSVTDEFSIIESRDRYGLVFTDTTVSRKYTKSFWGFSIDNKVYVNTKNYASGTNYQMNSTVGPFAKSVYLQMEAVSRYCYWSDHAYNPTNTAGVTQGTSLGPVSAVSVGVRIPTTVGVVLNINNGNFYVLNKQMMYSILKNDAKLLELYKESPGKGKVDIMFFFLSKYNEGHRDEIGRIEKDASIVLFRRIKKEKADTVAVSTPDSISYIVGPGQSTRFHFAQLTATFCVGTSCQDFVFSNSVTNYLQCTYQENDSQPKLELVEPRAAEFYLREIEGAKERGKR
ncbi:MAG TPA: hypothetical protein VIU12_14060 [Chryseolinea sp.]